MDWADPIRFHPLRGGAEGHPLADEPAQCLIVAMLQLAATAIGEVPAGRRLVVRSVFQRPINAQQIAGRGAGHVLPVGGYTVALGGDADDGLAVAHSSAA